MKISLKILILFLCIFIRTQSAAAAKNPLPEYAVRSEQDPFINQDSCMLCSPRTKAAGYSVIMQYFFFLDDNNENKIRIQRYIYIPVYTVEDQVGDQFDEFYVTYEKVGEWYANDPYVQETFEFVDLRFCRFRQR